MDDIDIILADLERRRSVLAEIPFWKNEQWDELQKIRDMNTKIFFFLKGKRATLYPDYSFSDALKEYESSNG
jgi:hypothetical protein